MQQLRQGQRIVLELAGVHRRLDSARIALIEAARRRRAVELLRQQRLEQWQAAQDKAETDAIDELAVIRAAQIEPVFRAENHG
jgi:flagellar export protein FliJ